MRSTRCAQSSCEMIVDQIRSLNRSIAELEKTIEAEGVKLKGTRT